MKMTTGRLLWARGGGGASGVADGPGTSCSQVGTLMVPRGRISRLKVPDGQPQRPPPQRGSVFPSTTHVPMAFAHNGTISNAPSHREPMVESLKRIAWHFWGALAPHLARAHQSRNRNGSQGQPQKKQGPPQPNRGQPQNYQGQPWPTPDQLGPPWINWGPPQINRGLPRNRRSQTGINRGRPRNQGASAPDQPAALTDKTHAPAPALASVSICCTKRHFC